MRERTQGRGVCVFCKRRIADQRLSVVIESGEPVHLDCYNELMRKQAGPSDAEAWRTLEKLLATPKGLSSHTSQTKSVSRMVLCIDDNPDLLQFEKLTLEQAGYDVLLGLNGLEGLQLAKNHEVQLVILDYEMPQLNGAEVARYLRAIKPEVPIIMVSGADLPDAAMGLADCSVPKTMLPMNLVIEVDRLLGMKRIEE